MSVFWVYWIAKHTVDHVGVVGLEKQLDCPHSPGH